MVRIWLLDSSNRVVRAGTQTCASVYEEPGLQSKSSILRHYMARGGSYKVVVAVLPARGASAEAPIRTEPWKWVQLDVIRSHQNDQGAAGSRCQDGVDIFCSGSLRCERARCK